MRLIKYFDCYLNVILFFVIAYFLILFIFFFKVCNFFNFVMFSHVLLKYILLQFTVLKKMYFFTHHITISENKSLRPKPHTIQTVSKQYPRLELVCPRS